MKHSCPAIVINVQSHCEKQTLMSRPVLIGQPVKIKKKEPITMRIEIDEKAPVSLPVVVDDDGDVVTLTAVTWTAADESLLTFEADPADMTKGFFASTGVVGSTTINAHVESAGGSADFTGAIEIGLSLPLGGEAIIGAGVKI